MSVWYPIVFGGIIISVWVAMAVQSGRLYHAFCTKYPREAQRLIPFAFSNFRHPEQFLFFFRKTSLPILKADQELWNLRQRLKLLLFLSLVVPFLCLALLAFVAMTCQ